MRRLTVPCVLAEWGLGDVPVLLARKFGFPGRLDAHERVWLTMTEIAGAAALTLNDALLGEVSDGPFETEITGLLRPHNHLTIAMTGQRAGEVAMEIRASAFLRDVAVRRIQDKCHVEGLVAGTCAGPLDLYILVDGRNVINQSVAAGERFTFAVEELGRRVRVELVHVSTVWSNLETELGSP